MRSNESVGFAHCCVDRPPFGLNYDDEGNHRFLRNNQGQKEWLRVQDRLNDTLDAIAAQAVSAKDQLQVSVVGMGLDPSCPITVREGSLLVIRWVRWGREDKLTQREECGWIETECVWMANSIKLLID